MYNNIAKDAKHQYDRLGLSSLKVQSPQLADTSRAMRGRTNLLSLSIIAHIIKIEGQQFTPESLYLSLYVCNIYKIMITHLQ